MSNNSIEVKIAKVETKIDMVLEKLDHLPCSTHLDKISNNKERIARLEVKAGAWGAVGGGITAALGAAIWWIKSKL